MSKATVFEKGKKCQKLFKLLANYIPKIEVYRMGRTTATVA